MTSRCTTISKEEREEHELLGHVQYRLWCRHCAAARGVGQHRQLREDPVDAIARKLCSIFYFMGEESETAPHIVVKDGKTSAYFSTGLDSKTSQYAVPFVAGAIQELGYKRILMKSDNETAIKRLKERVSECLPGVESTERIGPVPEVTTSYLYGKHGVEIRIWSLNEDKSHSWVRISHGSNKIRD